MATTFTADLVTSNPDLRTFALILNELGAWPVPASAAFTARLQAVQSRIYDAFDAAVLGLIARQYPEMKGWRCLVRVVVSADAPKNVDELVRRLNGVFSSDATFVEEQRK